MIWSGVLLSRVRLARNQLVPRRRGRGAAPGRLLLALTLALVLATFVTLALAGLFLKLQSDGADARDASVGLALALTAALVGLLAFDLHEAVSTLVLDSDLELLRRAPVPAWASFTLKLLDAFPRTSALLVILAVPALVGFAIIFPVPAWCWALVPLALVALWAVALGLGAAVAILILRVVPARTAREVLGLLSTFAVFALWIANSFVLPRLALDSESPLAMLHAIEAAAPWGFRLSPGTWIAEMMAAAGAGDAPAALRALAAALTAATVMLTAAGMMAAWGLGTVQARLSGAGARTPRRPQRAMRFPKQPHLLRALLNRDVRLFLRDWTVLGDIVVASALWTLLPLIGTPLYTLDRALLARAMLLALTVALGYEVGTRAIPFERRGLTWVRLAPVSAWRWVAGRAVSTLAVALPVVAVAALGVIFALGLTAREIAGTFTIVLPALVIALAIGLWTGAAFANFEWTHPRAMLTLTGRALATLLLLAQAVAWFAWTRFIAPGVPGRVVLVLPLALAALVVPVLLGLTARELRHRTWP
jgi:hypothetical protein